jgi:hypothetical protein
MAGELDDNRIRRIRFSDPHNLLNTTPEERWDILRQMSEDAWGSKGLSAPERIANRQIVRVIKLHEDR